MCFNEMLRKDGLMLIFDLSSLKRGIDSFDRALKYADERYLTIDVKGEENEIIHAAIVQNFEFTYKLCWKFMKRWLELNLTPGSMDGVSRRELF